MNTEKTINERRQRIVSAPVPLTGPGLRIRTSDFDTHIKETLIRDRAIKALQKRQEPRNRKDTITIRVKDLTLALWIAASLVWGVVLGALLF